MGTEIERKYLVGAVPNEVLEAAEPEQIRQGYVVIAADGAEVRVRQRGRRHYLTVKQGSGLVRAETEIVLSPAQFGALWPLVGSAMLEKVRRRVSLQGHEIELDVFAGALSGLAVVEVEFRSVKASAMFVPPAWFGREVTEDGRYKNRSLAVDGLPIGESDA